MFPYPHRRVLLVSPLQPAGVVAALKAATRPRFAARATKDAPPMLRDGKFIGEIDDNHFLLIRDAETRNNLVPHVEGIISSDAAGSKIFAYINLPPFVQRYILLLFGLLVLMSALAIVVWLERGPHNSLDVLILVFAAALPVLGIILPWIVFLPEARKAEEFLRATLRAA